MSKIKVQLSEKFNNKAVLVGSEEEAGFLKSLVAHNQLRDTEAGVNPSGATHELMIDRADNYRLKRVGFSAI